MWNAAESFAPAPSGRLDIPIEIVGGLPIAVMSRAQSAQLMTDLAAARRNRDQPALVFTSANGQVLSMCAQDADVLNLFMDADVIHADAELTELTWLPIESRVGISLAVGPTVWSLSSRRCTAPLIRDSW